MVKVTFGSVFLILSVLSTFVFAAAPRQFAYYTINNIATSNYIYSDGTEELGDLVSTTVTSDPSTTVVSIELKNRDKSFSEVKGKAGYYVSVETDAAGQYLVWAEKPSAWAFTTTDPADPNAVYTIKVIGEKLYWSDSGNGHLSLASSIDSQGATSFTIQSAQ